MEALLLTLGVVLLMVGTLVLLSRTWPRSSRLGGFRAGRGAGHEAGHGTEGGSDPGAAVPEDDDARWHWPDADEGGAPRP
jgi:hypothetical protein